MSDRAEARIEAELDGKSPDPDGNQEQVDIPSDGLEVDDITELSYVSDVIDNGDEYHVYLTASNDVYFTST